MRFLRPIAAALAAGAVLVSAVPAQAVTRTVDDDRAQCPNAPFTSIQRAVDAAGPRDLIDVCRGTYTETVTIGQGRSGLIIRPRDAAVVKGGFSVVDRSFVRWINGFIIDGDISVGEGSAISSLYRNDIRNGGIRLDGGEVGAIERNTIRGYPDAGVSIRTSLASGSGVATLLKANRITGGPGTTGVAVNPDGCEDPRILVELEDNHIAGNTGSGTGVDASCARLLLDTNRVSDNGTGIRLRNVDRSVIYRNTILATSGEGLVATDVRNSSFVRNDARFSGGTDCSDDSAGAGTAGTANRWIVNFGLESDPLGICRPR